jgi:hypothetical protein
MELFKYFKISPVKGSFKREIMDDAEYFSPKYSGYISNSKMGLINPAQGGSPSKFLQGFKSSNSQALALGSAVHEILLQPESFEIAEETKPSEKLGLAYDYFTEYRKEGRKLEESIILACNKADYFTSTLLNFGGLGLPSVYKTAIKKCLKYHFARKTTHTPEGKELIYLPSNLREKAIACIDSVHNNKKIMQQLNAPNSYYEDALFCDLRVTFPVDFKNPTGAQRDVTLKLKMKADHYILNEHTGELVLNDLKTSGKAVELFKGYTDASGDNKPGSFEIFHYFRQMAMYGWLLKSYAEEHFNREFALSANMLVVQTLKPFHAMMFKVTKEDIRRGWAEFKELICRIAYHEANGYDQLLELEEAQEEVPEFNFDEF